MMNDPKTLPERRLARRESYIRLGKEWFAKYKISDDRDKTSSEEALRSYQKCIELDSKLTRSVAVGLGEVHLERLLRQGHKDDADGAEKCFRLLLREDPQDFCTIAKLASILHFRYQCVVCLASLEEALDLCDSALAQVPEDHPALGELLAVCGSALLSFSEARNSASAIDTAIDLLRAGLALDYLSEKPRWCLTLSLSESLKRRFEVLEDETDILDARALLEKTQPLESLVHRERLWHSWIHVSVLHAQYNYTRDSQALHNLRQEYARVLENAKWASRSPLLAEIYQAAGKSWDESFFNARRREGIGSNLAQDGIGCAVDILSSWKPTPEEEAPGLAKYLFSLGESQILQHRWYWSPKILEQACVTIMTAIRLCDRRSASFTSRTCLYSRALRMMYSVTHDPMCLEAARVGLKAVLLYPISIGFKAKAELAAELGYLAKTSYDISLNPGHLAHAASHFEKAVEYSNKDFVSRITYLDALATVLIKKGANNSGDQASFELAATMLDSSLRLLQEKHVTFHDGKFTLAELQEARYRFLGDPQYAHKSIDIFQELCDAVDGTPQHKLMAALKISSLQTELEPMSKASARALSNTINLMLEVLSESDDREEQIWKIRALAPLSTRAAEVSLQADNSIRDTVQLLEKARSVIWSRLLDRKADIAGLKLKHRVLAERFEKLSRLISSADQGSKAQTAMSFEERREANRFQAADDYRKTVAEIRDQPGFEDFMLPLPGAEDLQHLAQEGPIVYFIQSTTCQAVLITKSGTKCAHLPAFSQSACHEHHEKLQEALKTFHQRPEIAAKVIEKVLLWLWTTAAEPVLRKLGSEAHRNADGSLVRLWWVSSGWINLLPIHAAGDHRRALRTGEDCTVMDRVISSYTPSLSVLQYTRRSMDRMVSSTAPLEKCKVLLAAMETTPGIEEDLDNAPKELDEIKAILETAFEVTAIASPRPRRKQVVENLSSCTMAHFALHGLAHETNPLLSLIYLQDWLTHPLRMGFLMRMNIAKCQFVYLSACEMVVNKDPLLREEGLHMSGAFQMAGVPSVVATWWKVLDAVSVRISRDFYKELKDSDGNFSVRRAAMSLHKVALSMRNEGMNPFVWAAYAHIGV